MIFSRHAFPHITLYIHDVNGHVNRGRRRVYVKYYAVAGLVNWSEQASQFHYVTSIFVGFTQWRPLSVSGPLGLRVLQSLFITTRRSHKEFDHCPDLLFFPSYDTQTKQLYSVTNFIKYILSIIIIILNFSFFFSY